MAHNPERVVASPYEGMRYGRTVMMKMPNPKPETRCTNEAPIHINTKNIAVSCIFFE